MKVLFPFNPLNEKEADGPFNEEYLLLKQKGIACSLFDYDSLAECRFQPKPRLAAGDIVLYRGWMLNPQAYQNLSNQVGESGSEMLTAPEQYVKSHHLPGWYADVREYTPESVFISQQDDVVCLAEQTGWNGFFVKDFVKSNYGEKGSIAKSPEEVSNIVALIREHRGEIEGGIALRKVEDLVAESEQRYFVFNGKPYSPNGVVPPLINKIASRHLMPFYSVDVVERADGELRLIEIGDGQVSDRKNWSVEAFCEVLLENV